MEYLNTLCFIPNLSNDLNRPGETTKAKYYSNGER